MNFFKPLYTREPRDLQIKILFSPIMDFIIHLSSTKDLENHTSTAKDIKHRLIIAT